MEIKVADIQNSPPEFLDSLTGVVREDDPIGTLVMTVKARDGDRGMPRKMIYELVTSESLSIPVQQRIVSAACRLKKSRKSSESIVREFCLFFCLFVFVNDKLHRLHLRVARRCCLDSPSSLQISRSRVLYRR